MNETTENSFDWRSAFDDTFEDISHHLLEYLPQFLGALLLLLLGWGIAHLLQKATRKLVQAGDALIGKILKKHHLRDESFKKASTHIIGRIIFWAVLAFFAATSANLLGWDIFSGWLEALVRFLPQVLTGLLIMLAGVLIGNVVQSMIINAEMKIGATQAAVLARVTFVAIVVSAVVVGVEHIGLNMHFLTEIVTIVLGVLLAGACLAFGLGARGMVANTIGAQYMRRNCRVGETILLAGYEGEILEIRQTCLVLDTPDGRVLIPARLFHEQASLIRVVSEQPPAEPEEVPPTGKESGDGA